MTEPKSIRPVPTRKVPRFAAVSTFLPFPEHDDPHDVDVMIVGAPFDGGTSFRPGARFGPRGVRQASALTRGFRPAPGLDLFDHLRCADGGDVATVPMSIDESLLRIATRIEEIARAGAVPAMVGGDHTTTLGALRALARVHGPLGLVHFDAHSDTYGPAWGFDVHHGTIFRNAVEEGLLRPGELVQIGIRGPLTEGHDLAFARKNGFEIIDVDAIKQNLMAVCQSLSRFRAYGPVYVSFDMDCMDPAYAPGTGTPVPGGITSYEALTIARSLVGIDIVGLDVVEISPDHDPSGNTSLLAATMLAQLLASLAATRKQKKEQAEVQP
ncbi:MAG: agmatinase [Myxococcaceae bacterium]|nr:agmatinase [Myxococcaceae bacterium]